MMTRGAANRGTRTGRRNYQAEAVLAAVAEVLPASSVAWRAVAARYRQLSREPVERDPSDLKRYFIRKLCQNNRKPTGRSAPNPVVARAQALYRQIENANLAASFGGGEDYGYGIGEEEEEGEEDDGDDEDGEEEGVVEQLLATAMQPHPAPVIAAPLSADAGNGEAGNTGSALASLAERLEALNASRPSLGSSTVSTVTTSSNPATVLMGPPAPASNLSGTKRKQRPLNTSSLPNYSSSAHETEEDDRKSKNSRPNPRQTAGQALNNLVNTMNQRNDSSTMMMMMQMQRDTMTQMMQMMMLAMGGRRPSKRKVDANAEDEEEDDD